MCSTLILYSSIQAGYHIFAFEALNLNKKQDFTSIDIRQYMQKVVVLNITRMKIITKQWMQIHFLF